MEAWLFALIVLVLVSMYGVWTIRSAKSGLSEGFAVTALQSQQAVCEKSYKECLNSGKTNAECTTANDACIAKTLGKDAPAAGRDVIAKKTEATCRSEYAACKKSAALCTRDLQSCLAFVGGGAGSPKIDIQGSAANPEFSDYLYKFFIPKVNAIYDEITDKNIKGPNGALLGPLLKAELNNQQEIDGLLKLSSDKQKEEINKTISNLNMLIRNYNLTSVKPLPPYTAGKLLSNTSDMASAPLTNAAQALTPQLNTQLKTVQQTTGTTSATTPSAAQLSAAQGTTPTIMTKDELMAAYKAYQETIKPHQTPSQQLPSLTASVPTDKGTMAEKIMMDSYYTPSIRQMIRDDVKRTVQEEIDASRIGNPYAAEYTMGY